MCLALTVAVTFGASGEGMKLLADVFLEMGFILSTAAELFSSL